MYRFKEPDEFEQWLFDMDDVLESYIASIDTSISKKLDFSSDSLEVITRLIFSKYSDLPPLMCASDDHDFYGRYIGEVFRKNLGGQWNIILDDPKYAFVGLPQLNYSTPLCPLTLITAMVARNQEDLIITVFDNMKKRMSS